MQILRIVLEEVCLELGVTPEQARARSKVEKYKQARAYFFELATELFGFPQRDLGEFMDRDHSTVCDSLKYFEKHFDQYRKTYLVLRDRLQQKLGVWSLARERVDVGFRPDYEHFSESYLAPLWKDRTEKDEILIRVDGFLSFYEERTKRAENLLLEVLPFFLGSGLTRSRAVELMEEIRKFMGEN